MRTVLNYNDGWQAFAQVIRAGKPFRANSMHGGPTDPQRMFRAHAGDERAGLADALYVVYSYATQIAWLSQSLGWCIPDVAYSQTTSRQQNIMREVARNWEQKQ